MKNYSIRLKRKSLRKNASIEVTINPLIQPFVQIPSAHTSEQEYIDRISAHDLFALYTTEIIKEDNIFSR